RKKRKIIAQNITAQNGGNWPVSLASSGFHIAQNSAHPDPQRSAPAENCAEKSCADDTQKSTQSGTQFGTQIIRKIRVPLGLIAGVPWG
ncbi:hypothetical protein ABN77_26360, partial [Salmonella enterica subsp. salamae]|nr:hypothetical protein [Salmonella enterica subsp. salamae]ECI4614076.1 hypothetical protein [Salmonella enterica subsp. diarizonae]